MAEARNVCAFVPARFILTALLFFGCAISYMLRSNMSLTIVAMVNKTALQMESEDNHTESNEDKQDFCGFNDTSQLSTTDREGSFVWNSQIQGVVLSGFFYGYASTMMIAGRLCEIYGPKWFIGCGILLGSILTILTPLFADLGVGALVAIRVLIGMTQAGLYPGIAALIPKWIPLNEKTRLYGISTSGAYAGVIFTMTIVGWLCNQEFLGGWPSVYYLFGLCGVVWSCFWLCFSANTPAESRWITQEELTYIAENLPPPTKKFPVPWKSMLSSFRVWAYVYSYSSSSWLLQTRITELPNFLDQVLHMSIETNGLVMALSSVIAFGFSIMSSFIADYLLNHKVLSVTNTRKLMQLIALLGAAGALFMVSQSGCNLSAGVAWFCVACLLQAFGVSGDEVLPVDMAPKFAGSLYAFGNTFYAVTGFLSPLLTGYILSIKGISVLVQWQIVFYISVGAALSGALVAALFWSAEPQPWNELVINDNYDECDASFEVKSDKAVLVDQQHLKAV